MRKDKSSRLPDNRKLYFTSSGFVKALPRSTRPMVLVPESDAGPVFSRREREPGCRLFAKLQIQLRFDSESHRRFGILRFGLPGDGLRCGLATTAPDLSCS